MAKVKMAMDYPVSADEVWKLIGAFGSLSSWHPAISKTTVEGEDGRVGATRRLELAGGGEIVERLEKVSDEERVYRYSIVSGPLPVADYEAEIHVVDKDDGGCEVVWSSEFKPKGVGENDAVRAIEGVYQAGLENLKRLYGLG